ncbi:MAG TPA: hypothetical protein VGC38_05085 [Pseudolabrys sp.]
MRHVAAAVVFACVLIASGLTAGAAKAGDYYEDGYYGHRHADNVWYSSSCCYRKIVRHERSVRYVRTDNDGYERHGYYEQPYSYGRSYRSSNYYDTPRRYDDYSYRSRRYDDYSYSDSPRRYVSDNYGYPAYTGYSSYEDNCRRIRISDGLGGWVWGERADCR